MKIIRFEPKPVWPYFRHNDSVSDRIRKLADIMDADFIAQNQDAVAYLKSKLGYQFPQSTD